MIYYTNSNNWLNRLRHWEHRKINLYILIEIYTLNLFDKSLYMPPFPRHYEAPRFDKYRGKVNPMDRIRVFCTSCTKLSDEPTYLMRLFPHSLDGPTLEWYLKLPGNIKSWKELAKKFILHFSFNITNEVTLSDLCSTKQKLGEPFRTFLLHWRNLIS